MTPREEIVDLLSGKKIVSRPAFSGLIHVTSPGLEKERLVFHEVHRDARKMATAAASTYKLTGLPSAVAPLDLYVEAEALGAEIDFRENAEYAFPQVKKAAFGSTKELTAQTLRFAQSDIFDGRVNLVCEAIRLLKENVGNEVVIGGMIPGPYTLLLLIVEPVKMFLEMKKEPQVIQDALFLLSSFLSQVGKAYREAGADFITVHDMGGSPAFIGPARYEQFAWRAEKQLIADLPKPRVLSVCGNTNQSMQLLAQTGADAISVDQTNDLVSSRAALSNTLLFGNIDPVGTLWQGDEAQIREAVSRAERSGVDAIWPGCDLVPQTSKENIKALFE